MLLLLLLGLLRGLVPILLVLLLLLLLILLWLLVSSILVTAHRHGLEWLLLGSGLLVCLGLHSAKGVYSRQSLTLILLLLIRVSLRIVVELAQSTELVARRRGKGLVAIGKDVVEVISLGLVSTVSSRRIEDIHQVAKSALWFCRNSRHGLSLWLLEEVVSWYANLTVTEIKFLFLRRLNFCLSAATIDCAEVGLTDKVHQVDILVLGLCLLFKSGLLPFCIEGV